MYTVIYENITFNFDQSASSTKIICVNAQYGIRMFQTVLSCVFFCLCLVSEGPPSSGKDHERSGLQPG